MSNALIEVYLYR